MTVLKVFRQSDAFRRCVRAPMQAGSAAMREMGNLYTAALPAWLAAGFAEAAASGPDLAGREVLAVGYGSGDAADAIPLRVVAGWEAAARRIDVTGALQNSIALTAEQYLALRESAVPAGLPPPHSGEFVVDRVGRDSGTRFQDRGIEYYRYVQ
jgi:hydroxymethylglutaryl-CoA synthase